MKAARSVLQFCSRLLMDKDILRVSSHLDPRLRDLQNHTHTHTHTHTQGQKQKNKITMSLKAPHIPLSKAKVGQEAYLLTVKEGMSNCE